MNPIVFGARDRLSVRRAVQVDCQVVTDAEFKLVGTAARDLSTHGMFVDSDADVTVGESLIVSLKVPRTQIWIDTEAEVARLVMGRRDGDRFRGVGIRFTSLSTIDRIVLATSLLGAPPPIPARSIRKDYARSVFRIAELNFRIAA